VWAACAAWLRAVLGQLPGGAPGNCPRLPAPRGRPRPQQPGAQTPTLMSRPSPAAARYSITGTMVMV
jgi:hypothetical protein